jgi:hypothetical protein
MRDAVSRSRKKAWPDMKRQGMISGGRPKMSRDSMHSEMAIRSRPVRKRCPGFSPRI